MRFQPKLVQTKKSLLPSGEMKWFKVQTNVFPLPWKEVDKVPTNMEGKLCSMYE